MSDSAVDCLAKQAREVETEENHALERKKTIHLNARVGVLLLLK